MAFRMKWKNNRGASCCECSVDSGGIEYFCSVYVFSGCEWTWHILFDSSTAEAQERPLADDDGNTVGMTEKAAKASIRRHLIESGKVRLADREGE